MAPGQRARQEAGAINPGFLNVWSQDDRKLFTLLDVCVPSRRKWVFIKGGCSSGRGVKWIGVVSYDKLVYHIVKITTPCFHCTHLCRMYGRFPKFHRVFVGPRPWHIEIRHRVKKHPQLICSDLRLSY